MKRIIDVDISPLGGHHIDLKQRDVGIKKSPKALTDLGANGA